MLQDIVSAHLRAASRVHDDSIALRLARVLDPLLEERPRFSAMASAASSGSRGTIDSGSLTPHRASGAQPFFQQTDVLDLALYLPVGKAKSFRERGSPLENLWEIAGAVENGALPLLDHLLGECPLEAIGAFCHLLK
ncbi:MAG: hypothetical protein M1818_004963 [Claussenomyces sp. TS43310]|nr:MAG: hypothetical protein M1818_004963 [Claussenomyces sp. TS43310]